MTPEQFEQFLKSNHEATGKAIQLHVNGKIDAMSKNLDAHAISDLKYQEKIDGNITWAVRLIIGALAVGLIALLFK